MQKAGVKVLRTWVRAQWRSISNRAYDFVLQGFNALNVTELPSALDSGLTYYQVR